MNNELENSNMRSEKMVQFLEDKCGDFLQDIPDNITPRNLKDKIKGVFDNIENALRLLKGW